ncbi:hypothetical protein NL676_034413, partial [Syzygium grande]
LDESDEELFIQSYDGNDASEFFQSNEARRSSSCEACNNPLEFFQSDGIRRSSSCRA